jgi:hypothetical protein
MKIEVNINEVIQGNVVSFLSDTNSNVIKFTSEFYNSGSIPYKARAKIEVYNDSQLIFTGWSEEKPLISGDRKNFVIYWYNNSTGNYSCKLRMYFGNEILDHEKIEVEIKNSSIPEDVFEIKNFRTYNNFVIFDLKSKKDVNNVILMPYRYQKSWIFEQSKINFLEKNNEKLVVLNYYPTLWTESHLTLFIVSNDGKYVTQQILPLEKESGLRWFIHYIIDNIKILLN